MQSKGWDYDKEGWEHYLLPIGKCSYEGDVKKLPLLSGNKNNALPNVYQHTLSGTLCILEETKNDRVVRTERRNYAKFDWGIPENILEKLTKIHNDPYAWWVGQFANYVVRLQPWFEKQLNQTAKKIVFSESVVG